jgi:uncharacterized membrane protein
MTGLYIMAALYVLAGLNHFRAPSFYRPMMPTSIPWPEGGIFLSGVAEILLGAFLLWPPARSLAAWGVIAFLVAVMPVHIYMLQARDTKFKEIPDFVIWARIPLQGLLIYWAYLYT